MNAIENDNIWLTGGILAVVAIGITALVYGAVALLVKMDDVGLKLSQIGRLQVTRSFGLWMVRAMPSLMAAISFIGTAAMLWVGGNILVHGVDVLGWSAPYDTIHHWAEDAAKAVGTAEGFVKWAVTAAIDGVIGFFVGLALIPIVTKVIAPVFSMLFPEKNAGSAAH